MSSRMISVIRSVRQGLQRMSSISKHWRIHVSQWPRTIAEQARSMRNMLKVWIREKDVRIDYFVSDAVYVIEESTCMLSWSVCDAYRVQLSDGLGQYTQLRYSIRVPGDSLPERLILTAFGGNGVVQAELFFSHIRADQKAVPPRYWFLRNRQQSKPKCSFRTSQCPLLFYK